MDLERLAGWLRCPSCGEDLAAVPPLVLRCPRGHAFDANRRGHATLLSPGTRVVGDSADMLAARERFLGAGHYSPVVDELASALGLGTRTGPAASAPAPASDAVRGPRIVDAGCGTGHYLHALLDRLEGRSGAVGLAADLSPRAVALAVRGRADVDGLVADTWRDLPVRDGVADLVLDVFAPRNLPEFHRVLVPAGRVAVVAAGPDHLRELRADGRALGIQPDKRERILEAAEGLFVHEDERHVRRVLRLTDEDVRLLIGMGPSAHHAAGDGDADARSDGSDRVDAGSHPGPHGGAVGGADGAPRHVDVTMDVMVHVLRRRDVPTDRDARSAHGEQRHTG